MINKAYLESKIVNGDGSGLLSEYFTENITVNGYEIKPFTSHPSYLGLYSPEGTALGVDAPDYILSYSPDLLDINFNSILVGGLGLGIVPYVCQDFASIDVLDNNQDVIDATAQLGHLNSNVNIINDDFTTFVPSTTYDIIMVDIWYNPLTVELSNQIIAKYNPYLNEGGFIYIPINARVEGLEDKVKIYKTI